MVKSYNTKLAQRYEDGKINQGTKPLLELCIITDSPILNMISGNDESLSSRRTELIKLAYEFRSINILHYFFNVDGRWKFPKENHFEQELMILLMSMHDEPIFKTHFHEYSIRRKIKCVEENELQTDDADRPLQKGEKRISLQGELWRYFPEKFEIINDSGMDSGTEFLLSRALATDNISIMKYLLKKTKSTVTHVHAR